MMMMMMMINGYLDRTLFILNYRIPFPTCNICHLLYTHIQSKFKFLNRCYKINYTPSSTCDIFSKLTSSDYFTVDIFL